MTQDTIAVDVVAEYNTVQTGLGEECAAKLLSVTRGDSGVHVVAVRLPSVRPEYLPGDPERVTEAWAFVASGEWEPHEEIPPFHTVAAKAPARKLFQWTAKGDVPWQEVIESVRENAHLAV